MREHLLRDRYHITGNVLEPIRESGPSRMSKCRFPSWSKGWGTTSPATVLLVVVVLIFTDLLAFVLIGVTFFQISYTVLVVWIVVPPIAQPLAIILGPVFMLSESPRLGRVYASLTLFGIVSGIIATAGIIADLTTIDSWIFDFLEFLIVCVVKVALFVFTNIHISNLEAAADMSFLGSPQDDFVGCLVASTNHEGDMDGRSEGGRSESGPSEDPSFDRPGRRISGTLHPSDALRPWEEAHRHIGFDHDAAGKALSSSPRNNARIRDRSPSPLHVPPRGFTNNLQRSWGFSKPQFSEPLGGEDWQAHSSSVKQLSASAPAGAVHQEASPF